MGETRQIYAINDKIYLHFHISIYFFADVPHLTKTARNCSYHSWSGHCTQYMWNDNKYLIWQHIVQVYQDELENELKILPKLTHGHLYPTPFSVITVKYVVQKLSKIMLLALSTFETPEGTATAECCEMINLFFDCLNTEYLT